MKKKNSIQMYFPCLLVIVSSKLFLEVFFSSNLTALCFPYGSECSSCVTGSIHATAQGEVTKGHQPSSGSRNFRMQEKRQYPGFSCVDTCESGEMRSDFKRDVRVFPKSLYSKTRFFNSHIGLSL